MDLTTSWERKGIRKGRREGQQKGLEQGREQGLEQGIEQGLEQGIEQGLEQGIEQGLERGRKEGALVFLLRILRKKFGNLSADYSSRIESLTLEQLELLNEALPALSSIDNLNNWLESEIRQNGRKN